MDRVIRDVMCRGVVTCPVDETADEAARIMLDNDVSALVVVDERLDACGIVSKTDLMAHYGEDLSLVTAEDVMSSKILTVSPDTPVHEAVMTMLKNKVHQLVIVTKGRTHRRPVGIFTNGDAVGLMTGKPAKQSAAQIRCAECLRKLISLGADDENESIEECSEI